jgi:ATP-binding cassette subfamily C protein
MPAAKGASLYAMVPAREALLWAIIFSIAANTLLLILPFYCIQVFDRVITSGSVETLVGLTAIAVIGLAFGAAFDAIRGRILTRFAVIFEQALAPRVLEASIFQSGTDGASAQDLGRVRELRNFLSSGMVATLLDAPFLPAFVLILYLIYPWFGALTLIGSAILLALAFLSATISRSEVAQASGSAVRTQALLDSIVKHARLVRAMGWSQGAIREFLRINDAALAPVVRATEQVAAIAAIARALRMMLQVSAIGLGAWLVLQNELLPGGMIAGSILISRTLQPVENLLSAWRALTSAQDAWVRIGDVLAAGGRRRRHTRLPPPTGALEVSRVVYQLPGAKRPILSGISFSCRPGEITVVIGPTGAGKSTLLRMIAGLEQPSAGTIRLDGASLDNWDPDLLGQFVGYLPQDVELLGGTVAEAIAGFDDQARDEDIVAAAILANAHEMILSLPQAYQTEIGREGSKLSGGQRQRIGLARAFYGCRRLMLLDEPNSNLDPDGEEALCAALRAAQARGATFVIVTHRPRLLTIADSVLFLRDGKQVAFGPPSGVLPQTIKGATPLQRPPVPTRAGALRLPTAGGH